MTVRRTIILLVAIMLAIPLIAITVQTTENRPAQPEQQAASTQTPNSQGQGRGNFGGGQFTPQATETAVPGISALGSVAANSSILVNFLASGKVTGVYVQVGDFVKAGDVLADIDGTNDWNGYNQAVLNMQKAQIALNALYLPPTSDALKSAQAQIAAAQAAYSSAATAVSSGQIQADQLKVQQAQQNLAGLQAARSNMSGTDSQIALQEAKIGAATFNAQIAKLQLQADQTPNSASLWQASLKIQQAQLSLQQLEAGPTMAQVDSANIALQKAEAAVLDAQTALEQTQLIAPTSGYVTAVNIQVGSSEQGGSTSSASSSSSSSSSSTTSTASTTAAVELEDISQFKITVPVNELDIEKVKVGEPVTITLDSLPNTTFQGKVDNISWLSTTNSDGIVTYSVEITMTTSDPRVRIGMTGQVTIDTTGNTGSSAT